MSLWYNHRKKHDVKGKIIVLLAFRERQQNETVAKNQIQYLLFKTKISAL